MLNNAAAVAAHMVLSCATKRGSAVLAIAIYSALDNVEDRGAFLAALYDQERTEAEGSPHA